MSGMLQLYMLRPFTNLGHVEEFCYLLQKKDVSYGQIVQLHAISRNQTSDFVLINVLQENGTSVNAGMNE
jgi:hypothetical protein